MRARNFFPPFSIFLALFLSFSSPVSLAETEVHEMVTLKSLVQEALDKNPGIHARKSSYLAARSKVLGAFLPEDPKFGVDVEGQPDIFTFGGRTDNEFMAEQTIPFPTKLILKGILAAKEAQVQYQKYKQEERDVIWHIEQPYYELLLARKTLTVLEETNRLLEQVVQTATSRYESGQAPQGDLLKVQIERARVSLEIFDWKEKGHLAQAHFSHILNRKLETNYVIKDEISHSVLAYSRTEIEKIGLAKRPELKALEAAIQKAKTQRSLTRQEWLPDISLRYEGRQFKGKDPITEHDTFLGVTVPLWSVLRSVGGNWKSSDRELESAKEEYEKMKNEVLLKVHEAYSKLKSAENAVNSYEKVILPKSQQQVELSLSAYETGKGDFLSVIDAERTLKTAQIEYAKSRAGYEMAFSDLRFAVGDNLERAAS